MCSGRTDHQKIIIAAMEIKVRGYGRIFHCRLQYAASLSLCKTVSQPWFGFCMLPRNIRLFLCKSSFSGCIGCFIDRAHGSDFGPAISAVPGQRFDLQQVFEQKFVPRSYHSAPRLAERRAGRRRLLQRVCSLVPLGECSNHLPVHGSIHLWCVRSALAFIPCCGRRRCDKS